MKKRFLTGFNLLLATASLALVGCHTQKTGTKDVQSARSNVKKYGVPEIIETKYGLPGYIDMPDTLLVPPPPPDTIIQQAPAEDERHRPQPLKYGPPPSRR